MLNRIDRSHSVVSHRLIPRRLCMVIAAIGCVLIFSNIALADPGTDPGRKAKPTQQKPKKQRPTGEGGQQGGGNRQAGGGNLPPLPVPDVEETPPGTYPEGTYLIGIEDQLAVQVWKEDIGGNVEVRPDGMISMPIVGDIVAVGRTPMELAREIQDRLKEFLTTPTVTVSVTGINSYRVYIFGNVGHGGIFNFRSPTRLMEAIVQAGGFTQFADDKHVRVFSEKGDGTQEVVEINTRNFTEGKDLSLNILLKPRDMIYVP
jgi:polysaccharide export outer membrane protein